MINFFLYPLRRLRLKHPEVDTRRLSNLTKLFCYSRYQNISTVIESNKLGQLVHKQLRVLPICNFGKRPCPIFLEFGVQSFRRCDLQCLFSRQSKTVEVVVLHKTIFGEASLHFHRLLEVVVEIGAYDNRHSIHSHVITNRIPPMRRRSGTSSGTGGRSRSFPPTSGSIRFRNNDFASQFLEIRSFRP